MNQEEALLYKRQFSHVLRPIMEMLEVKKQNMNIDDWSVRVLDVEKRIINNPDQYIGRDLPGVHIVTRLIKEIFEDFLQEQLNTVE